MPARLWAASALVAMCICGAAPAFATDLSDPYYPPRTGAPYDDQRYGDVYGHPPPRYAEPRYRGPRYSERYDEPRYNEPRYGEPRYGERYTQPRYGGYRRPPPAYRDENGRDENGRDENGYLEPFSGPRRFSGHHYGAPQRDPDCVPRHEIKRRLVEEGWSDFSSPELRGEVGVVHARRPNGDFYKLKVDRCSGEILNARRVPGPHGPYALGDRFYGRSF